MELQNSGYVFLKRTKYLTISQKDVYGCLQIYWARRTGHITAVTMVRVLKCHHFMYQEVFTTDNEPHVIHTTESQVFVATSSCYIEVHSLEQHGCPLVAKFPTVSTVKVMTYSNSDNFVATIEEPTTSDETQDTVRVYINWQCERNEQPLRARIAGHMTSLRQQEGENTAPRFEVIEIPLKSQPCCLATNLATGTLAIGIEQTLLLYGFCNKVVAKQKYRDMKCLLELSFSFPVIQVSLCEEFIACASYNELQVIQLKGHKPTTPTPDVAMDNPFKKITSEVTFSEIQALRRRRLKSCSPSLSQMSTSSKSADETNRDYIIDDEYYSHWTFEESDEEKPPEAAPKRPFFGNRGSRGAGTGQTVRNPNKKTIVLKSMRHRSSAKQKQMQRELEKTGIMFGPISAPIDCTVTVEYEDVCDPAESKPGYLSNDVITFLFRKFEQGGDDLHSLQLKPIYRPAEGDSSEMACSRCTDCRAWFGSCHRSQLIGMYCFISQPQVGELFKVSGRPQQLAVYSYASEALQCCLSENMLYVATDNCLEVYTSRCLTSAMHDIMAFDNVNSSLPPVDLEVCLLGLQPFISTQLVALSNQMVVMLSKHIAEGKGEEEEVNWSVYALKMPSIIDLYKDMMELVSEYEQTSLGGAEIVHLLNEAFLLLRGDQFRTNDTDLCCRDYLRTVAGRLGNFYARPGCEQWQLALPYYVMSCLSVENIVQKAHRNQKGKYGKGLMLYLDHTLFLDAEPIHISQAMGTKVLEVYAEMDPSKLSSVILKSRLHDYDPEQALELLAKCKDTVYADVCASVKKLDVLAEVSVHLLQGDQADAEAALFTLSRTELLQAGVDNHQILHVGFTQLTPLAQMIRRHKLSIFLKIVIDLLDNNIFTLETAIMLLKAPGDSQETSPNPHVIQLLEKILNDHKRQLMFHEASRMLIDMYLCQLMRAMAVTASTSKMVTVADVLRRGSGHFGKRYSWLDNVPPFQGSDSLWRPCLFLASPIGSSGKAYVAATCSPRPQRRLSTERNLAQKCPCSSCNAVLLKLQSLMCSKFASSDIFEYLLNKLDKCVGLKGYDSLWLLSMARKEPHLAVDLLLKKYPRALPGFATQVSKKLQDVWPHTVKSLLHIIQEQELASHPDHKVESSVLPSDTRGNDTLALHVEVLKEVLLLAVEVKSPQEFIGLLPDHANSRFFLPFLEKSYKSYGAHKLKKIIVQKAETLSGIA